MLKKHGEDEDVQWFEYSTGYFDPTTRVEWDKGTMVVELPSDFAKYLIHKSYARPMTDEEVRALKVPEKEAEAPPQRPKKGEST
jgi:hypothetical protein